MSLLPDEYLTALGRGGRELIQRRDGTAFGLDAVLLAHFAAIPRGGRAIDLGTGTGVIALLLADAHPDATIDAIELDAGLADMATRSVTRNALAERVFVRQGDLRQIAGLYPASGHATVIANPPYFPAADGRLSPKPVRAGMRSELTCSLTDVCQAAAWLLKGSGQFFLIHRPERLVDILSECRGHGLEPKRLRFVQPNPTAPPNLLLLAARRGARPGLRVEPPLIVRAGGDYTPELRAIYGESPAGPEV